MSVSLLDTIIDEISPVTLSTAKLDAEFKTVTKTLKNPDPDMWDKRDKALRMLGSLALGLDDSNRDSFSKNLKSLKTTLATQVEDLRSAIVRTSAAVCVLLDLHARSVFTSIFEFLMPSFIKQLAVKAIPTRESSHECLHRIIESNQNPKFLKVLFSYVGDKDKGIRARVSGYIKAVADSWDKPLVQKNLKELFKYLKVAQGDGDATARQNARLAIATIGTTFPAAVSQFVKTIEDPKQRKALDIVLPESVKVLLEGGDSQSKPKPKSKASSRRSTGGQPAPKKEKPAARASVSGSPSHDAVAAAQSSSKSAEGEGKKKRTVLPSRRKQTVSQESPRTMAKQAALNNKKNVNSNSSLQAQLKAKALASSTGLGPGKAVQSTTTSPQSAQQTPGTTPGDLLARLQALREQVQALPQP